MMMKKKIRKSVDICKNANPKPAGIVNQVEKDGEIDLRRYISHAAKGHKFVQGSTGLI